LSLKSFTFTKRWGFIRRLDFELLIGFDCSSQCTASALLTLDKYRVIPALGKLFTSFAIYLLGMIKVTEDLKSLPFRSWPFAIVLASVFLNILFLSIGWTTSSKAHASICQPNGTPNAKYAGLNAGDPPSPLSISSMFQIDLAFGNFSFGTAKTIDVIFDLVIGRGIQFLMAWYGYQVATDSLIQTMENQSVSYQVFCGLLFHGISLQSLWELLRNGLGMKKWKRRRTISLAFVMIYILAFPTLISAMTGYTSRWLPYATFNNGTLTPISDEYVHAKYMIKDGSRVGLKDNVLIQTTDGMLTNATFICE
jgi:hypothetical protein